jgi:DNA-binding transcriptional regulator YiaG
MTAQELRESRKAFRLSQAELAAELGVTSRQVQNWEHGRTPISRLVEYAMLWLKHTKQAEEPADRS